MKIVWENIKSFFKKLDNHHISEYTAQCAYYTILSFIPFIMLIVTLIQYTSISKETLFSIMRSIEKNINARTGGKMSAGVIMFSRQHGNLCETKNAKELFSMIVKE